MSRVGEPIPAAYLGTLTGACPMCSAPAGQYCRDDRGRNRRVPCVRRPRSAVPVAHTDENDPLPVSPGPSEDPEPTQDHSNGHRGSACAQIDFSEPRHERESAQPAYPRNNRELDL